MDYNKKIKADVADVHQDFIKAVNTHKIADWFNTCTNYYLIYDKNHIYVGAEVVMTSNGTKVILYTRTGQLVGTLHGAQHVHSIGNDYINDLNKFIEDNYAF